MSEFNDKKVDEILTAWKKTLKEKIDAFKDEAKKVATWEDELRTQQAYLTSLESDVKKLETQSK